MYIRIYNLVNTNFKTAIQVLYRFVYSLAVHVLSPENAILGHSLALPPPEPFPTPSSTPLPPAFNLSQSGTFSINSTLLPVDLEIGAYLIGGLTCFRGSGWPLGSSAWQGCQFSWEAIAQANIESNWSMSCQCKFGQSLVSTEECKITSISLW